MDVVQVRLSCGSKRLTCYVENLVKPGNSVLLKDDPDRIWIVDAVDTEPVDLKTIHRKWNNNI